MRIVTWNIRHGGGGRIGAIEAALADQDADVIVLTEARLTTPTVALRARLHSMGYVHQRTPGTETKKNSVLIASKRALGTTAAPETSPDATHRLQQCSWAGLNIAAVYFPSKSPGIISYHAALAPLAEKWLSAPTVLLGDFNSAVGEMDVEARPFFPSGGLQTLIAQGWTDAWRHKHPDAEEYTWFSNAGNGFRIDAAFLSPSLLPSLVAANYEHGPRVAGTSDHSLLSLELAWPRDA